MISITPNSFFLLFFTLFSCFSHLALSSNICQGLVLQGGGDQGAYQAGALQGLLEALGSEQIQYDVASGITIGALNAAWISQFPKGQEEPMIDSLTNFWLTLKASDIYKNWPGGVVQGLLNEPSLYNLAPGEQYLRTHITKDPQRYVAVGTADANFGTYQVFDNFNADMKVEDFLDSVRASMGIAGVFPYVDIAGETYFDGSVLKSMDIASVVDKCRDINGGVDSDIQIDILMLTAKALTPKDLTKDYNALEMLFKTLAIMGFHDAMYSLLRAQQSFPNVTFRYVIQPSNDLPSSKVPLDFDHETIVKILAQGSEDAKAAVQKGVGVTFEEFVADAKEQMNERYGKKVSSDFLMRKFFDQVSQIQIEQQKQQFMN